MENNELNQEKQINHKKYFITISIIFIFLYLIASWMQSEQDKNTQIEKNEMNNYYQSEKYKNTSESYEQHKKDKEFIQDMYKESEKLNNQ